MTAQHSPQVRVGAVGWHICLLVFHAAAGFKAQDGRTGTGPELHSSEQGMEPPRHFAQQHLVPQPRDAGQALSLLVTPKLKCNNKPGDAGAPGAC